MYAKIKILLQNYEVWEFFAGFNRLETFFVLNWQYM